MHKTAIASLYYSYLSGAVSRDKINDRPLRVSRFSAGLAVSPRACSVFTGDDPLMYVLTHAHTVQTGTERLLAVRAEIVAVTVAVEVSGSPA